MKPFPIPVVMVGTASQVGETPPPRHDPSWAPGISYPPLSRDPVSRETAAAARAVLQRLLDMVERRGFAAPDLSLPLTGVAAGIVAEVNELLGHGEISVLVRSDRPVRIQESEFAGVWRVQTLREDGGPLTDEIEVGPIPAVVRKVVGTVLRREVDWVGVGSGIMNGPAILRELLEASERHLPGAEPHVIDLTRLPMTDQDLALLSSRLGEGAVTILSRGYGNCRMSSTALPHTWWVRYYDGTDQIILNTLEVTDVPLVALAAEVDFDDGIARMRERLVAH